MSFRLKAATIVALAISALSAVVASDASIAAGTAASGYIVPVTIPTSSVEAPASLDPHVVFSAPREVAQPLTSNKTAEGADGSVNGDDNVPAASLAELVAEQPLPAQIDDQMRCLAGAIYYESKGESLAGQLAVARVIINRAESGRFATSLCGVVTQRGQFSFVHGSIVPQPPVGSRDWHEAVAIAQIAMTDSWNSQAEGALYFHARRVSPNWGKQKLASIDNHIFYR